MNSFEINTENINKLIQTSIDAGNAIMDIYDTNFVIEEKIDSSPLTEADLVSNKIITESLLKISTDIPIISEESSEISLNERSSWNEFWLVDPLDGTKEFIKKNGEFTTNIALIRQNKPVFGIIHIPATKETYWGSEELGAFYLKNNSSKREKISVCKNKNKKIRIVSSRSHPSGDLKALLDKIGDYETIGVGSSLKFCLLAKGNADLYPRLGPTCQWDTAAGEIIARSSGAIIVDLENKPILYNQKDTFLNPYFIVCANETIKKEILQLI